MTTIYSKAGTDAAISGAVAAIPAPDLSGYVPTTVTQGLYERSVPTPGGASITPICADPHVAGRIWAVQGTSIGYTDDHGTTFTATVVTPGATIVQAKITANFMWLLISAQTSKSGSLWRSPKPTASGSGLNFVKQFDLTGMVNGLAGAAADIVVANSCFRNGCMAIPDDESMVYLLLYGGGSGLQSAGAVTDVVATAGSDIIWSPSAGNNQFVGSNVGKSFTIAGAGVGGATLSGTIAEIYSSYRMRLSTIVRTTVDPATLSIPEQPVGAGVLKNGPRLYTCATPNAAQMTFTLAFWGWQFARHGHALRLINGTLWASLGDYPFPAPQSGVIPLTEVGLWAATNAAATAWVQVAGVSSSLPYEPIDFIPVNIAGNPMIVGESDSKMGVGPIIYPTQTAASGQAPYVAHRLPMPHRQTMRCIYLTPAGDLMWYGTGENGSIGPTDAVWISKSPFATPVLLESLALNTVTHPQEAIPDGDFVWFGNNRIRVEEFRT